MNEFLYLYLNSLSVSGQYDRVLVNLATIVTIEPTTTGYGTIIFIGNAANRTTRDFYVSVVQQIQQRSFIYDIH